MNELDIWAVCKDYSKECIDHEFKIFREYLVWKRDNSLRISVIAENEWDTKDADILHNQGILFDRQIKELDFYLESKRELTPEEKADEELEKKLKNNS